MDEQVDIMAGMPNPNDEEIQESLKNDYEAFLRQQELDALLGNHE